MEKRLAIDIGGSKVLVGVVDETGIVVEYDRKEYSSAYSLDTLYADVKRMAAPYMEKYKPEICGVSLPGQDRPAKEMGALANEGDEIAVAAYRRAAKAQGAVIAKSATLLDVNVCYLGGGVSQSLDLFKDETLSQKSTINCFFRLIKPSKSNIRGLDTMRPCAARRRLYTVRTNNEN